MLRWPYRREAGALLVVGEVALATLIVLAAGLLTRSYRDLMAVDPGFDPDNVLVVDLVLPLADYPDAASIVSFFTGMQQRISALPGVESASAISSLPLDAGLSNTDFEIENRPLSEFLAWLAREQGWRVHYASERLQEQAAQIRLHGSLEGLEVAAMLERVVLVTGVKLEVRHGVLWVGA